jgi:hypothetical protein
VAGVGAQRHGQPGVGGVGQYGQQGGELLRGLGDEQFLGMRDDQGDVPGLGGIAQGVGERVPVAAEVTGETQSPRHLLEEGGAGPAFAAVDDRRRRTGGHRQPVRQRTFGGSHGIP